MMTWLRFCCLIPFSICDLDEDSKHTLLTGAGESSGGQGAATNPDLVTCLRAQGMGPHLSPGRPGLTCWRSFRVPRLTDPAREGKSHKVLLS